MAGSHLRNTDAMRKTPRCSAKTRRGTSCQAPAVRGKKRCRMHGGAKGTGAPVGNENALKHGMYTRETLAFQKHVRDLLREGAKTVEEI